MAFFETFTASIRQKWLDYFHTNQAWLRLQMDGTSVRTPDGGRRPSSLLILGVVNALEPKLNNLMLPFYKLNSDEDALVEVLGLNFDPDMELAKDVGSRPAAEGSNLESSRLLPDASEDL